MPDPRSAARTVRGRLLPVARAARRRARELRWRDEWTHETRPGPLDLDSARTIDRAFPHGDASVAVLTVGPFHNSIGDLSTSIVTQRWLGGAGVPSYPSSFWEPTGRTCVVGGGDILGYPRGGSWAHVKDALVPPGRHVLNAAGVALDEAPRIPFDRLREYRLLSVRDEASVDLFERHGLEADLVPCPATLQPGIPLSSLRHLPRYGATAALEPQGYVVAHRNPKTVLAARRLADLGHRIVVVDMQAHARHPWPAPGMQVPVTHSPEVVMGLVRDASAVVTSSLHLAIFAIGAGVPFAVARTGDYQSDKVERYLARAGAAIAASDLADPMRTLDGVAEIIDSVSIRERAAATTHLDRVVAALGDAGAAETGPGG